MAQGKILTCAKEIEAYLGMSMETAQEHNFPIARFGRLVGPMLTIWIKHVSETARKQNKRTRDEKISNYQDRIDFT